MITIDQIADQLIKVHRTKNGYMACCPAHKDRSPSLSITQVEDRILMHCFAGCDIQSIVNALGIRVSDLYPDDSSSGFGSVQELRRLKYEELNTHENLLKAMIENMISKGEDVTPEDRQRLNLAITRIQKLEVLLND